MTKRKPGVFEEAAEMLKRANDPVCVEQCLDCERIDLAIRALKILGGATTFNRESYLDFTTRKKLAALLLKARRKP